MTDKELEKKAEQYSSKYARQYYHNDKSGFTTSEEEVCKAYVAGAKELENEYMLKLKDTSLVRALKDSIIMNEKLSSQEQQELCAWIEAAMEFGENLDECAKENAELKKQQFSLRNERNTFLAQNEQYEKDLIDFNENLTEAKDLIRNLLRVTYGEGWNYNLDWKVKAEQFLKE